MTNKLAVLKQQSVRAVKVHGPPWHPSVQSLFLRILRRKQPWVLHAQGKKDGLKTPTVLQGDVALIASWVWKHWQMCRISEREKAMRSTNFILLRRKWKPKQANDLPMSHSLIWNCTRSPSLLPSPYSPPPKSPVLFTPHQHATHSSVCIRKDSMCDCQIQPDPY